MAVTSGMPTRRPVALVTGASSGIGREFAHQLAGLGHDLVLVARDVERLRGVAAELDVAYGAGSEVLVADLSDREQTEAVCRRVADPERPVDVLVNNAGFGYSKPFLRNDIGSEEAGLDVMVRAVLLTCHAAGNAMRGRGRGVIINVSSVASFIATGTYNAEKSFVTTFSEGLAGELRDSGVRVVVLCPGFVRTEFQQRAGGPGRRRADVRAVPASPARSVLWLTAHDVVRECLDDVARGRVVCVPSLRYKAVVGMLRVLPRSVARSRVVRGRSRPR